MKRFLLVAAVAAATAPALAADVGVSVQVGEPGFYGRIDIGNLPQPWLIYARRS
jgi:opacity protein-like surface antigen